MKIIVLNCGSSSIKYQLIEVESCSEYELLAKGQVERIGLNDSILTHKPAHKPAHEFVKSIPDHTTGINMILEILTDSKHGVIESLSEIAAAGHRIAHGGEYFEDSAIVNDDVKRKIESCIELAPLHNPANLRGVLAVEKILPAIPQVVVFDTSFHQTIPMENFLYALPYKYYEEMKIRRYGFHGTSHKFVAERACEMTGLNFNTSKIITCHIGNGASVTAIRNGESFNTSMGFTPVDGLVMGTRCGTVDPGALLYIMEKERMSVKDANDLINKESGLTGISGVSNDMRDMHKAANSGNKRAEMAIQMFVGRLKRFIGSYIADLGGVDAIVFTGGIGEHDQEVRKLVASNMEFLGIELDEAVNQDAFGKDAIISTDNSKVKLVVACTNEELVIAYDTYRLLRTKPCQ